MNFLLTEEQTAFAEMASGLFADYCSDDQLRAHDKSDAPYMQALWQQCVASGLHTILIPESQGGLGLGMTELMAVLEQQGRALANVPLWETQVGATALAKFADDSLSPVIEQVLSGDVLLSLSLEALTQSRGSSLQLARSGDNWKLSGIAPAVPLASVSRYALLAAEAFAGMHLVLVDLKD